LSIDKSFADPLFKDISITLSDNEKMGLIGTNGSGKSTLLKIFAGLESQDAGDLIITKNVRVVYLPQIEKFPDNSTITDVLFDALTDESYDEAQKYKKVERSVNISGFDPDQKVKELSGGMKKRISILKALNYEPDVLLLDEPTNHLDIEGIEWIEGILKKASFAFVLVCHDRYFLENVTNRIVELGKSYPGGYLKIEGAYSRFLEAKRAFLENQIKKEESLSNKMRREKDWLARSPKARTTKAQYRIDDAARLSQELGDVKFRNSQTKNINIDFSGTDRKTKQLIKIRDAGVEFEGRKIFENIDITLSPGTRIGLVGRNGTGKTTFMSTINDTLPLNEGTIKWVDGLKVVTFDQNREQLDQNMTLRKALVPDGDSVVYRDRTVHIVTWAQRFLFSKDQLDLQIKRLSGGEQARILIANLMEKPADVLLLDEPTNDLDIQSLEVLEDSLMDFPGAIVLVSHDRSFLDSLTNHILAFDETKDVVSFSGYDQWLQSKKNKSKKNNSKKNKSKNQKKVKEKALDKPKKDREKKAAKMSYKDKFELENIEDNIAKAEQLVDQVSEKLNQPEVISDKDKLKSCCEDLDKAKAEVDRLYSRWEELELLK
jgi:ATP-binding cassette subfamily F protein uup